MSNSIKLLKMGLISLVLPTCLQAQNVIISTSNSPNEPSIMVDPKNSDHLIAGANLNNYYTSDDGGETWTENILTSPQGVWGDPVIDVDTNGNFYFFHLSNPPTGNWIDRIVCQKTTDLGNTWTLGTYTGLNGTKAQDKQWSIVDRSNNNIYLTWTQFDEYGSSNPNDSSLILFSKSLDEGDTWSTPVRVSQQAGNCIDEDDTVEGATPAIGPNGEIFVAWSGPKGLVFNRSTDQGDTWLNEEILIDSLTTGWEYDIPGINRANGLPVLKCDLSGGPNHGTLYLNWSDQRNGLNNTDVFFSKSTDGGYTWSDPTLVNDDSGETHQFFTWMDIDQTTGHLFFIFYDRRHYSPITFQTDVYMAISQDGGTTFENRRISDAPFVPNPDIFFGDYTNIVAHASKVHPIWTRLEQGQLSLLTDNTPIDQILSTPEPEVTIDNNQIQHYPNPITNVSYVSFKLHQDAQINLEIYDLQGHLLKVLVEDKTMSYGKHIIPIQLNDLGLSSGSYFKKLTIDGEPHVMKVFVVE